MIFRVTIAAATAVPEDAEGRVGQQPYHRNDAIVDAMQRRVGEHGPACESDVDCAHVTGCVRCAQSGFCTDVPLPAAE